MFQYVLYVELPNGMTVAIPLNRVGVSIEKTIRKIEENWGSRNPLKSGRCFNISMFIDVTVFGKMGRNPLKSGRCFNLMYACLYLGSEKVAIPLNRVGVSIKTENGLVAIETMSQSP